MRRFAILALLLLAAGGASAAPEAGSAPGPAKVLRYVSQRSKEAYLREGPGYDHRILWTYRHRGYPFAVTAQFDVWRRVVDAEGIVGWMSANMLSDQRTVLVTGKGRAQIHADEHGGKVVGLADPGAVADVKACGPQACHIKGEDVDGWIDKARVWGIGADETFK